MWVFICVAFINVYRRSYRSRLMMLAILIRMITICFSKFPPVCMDKNSSNFQNVFFLNEWLCVSLFQSVHMAHALRRISYATCEPKHAHFSFLAREPKGHFSLQYCHSFITRTSEQVSRALQIFFSSAFFIYLLSN